jgi:hypothetical protein
MLFRKIHFDKGVCTPSGLDILFRVLGVGQERAGQSCVSVNT